MDEGGDGPSCRMVLTVQNHGDFLAVSRCEDVVEESGFAGSEIACRRELALISTQNYAFSRFSCSHEG